jgi:hypothetical protein
MLVGNYKILFIESTSNLMMVPYQKNMNCWKRTLLTFYRGPGLKHLAAANSLFIPVSNVTENEACYVSPSQATEKGKQHEYARKKIQVKRGGGGGGGGYLLYR